MTQEDRDSLKEYFRCGNRKKRRHVMLGRREKKIKREFGLVEPRRLRGKARRFEERQHCHLIFGLQRSAGQVRKGKER